MTTPLDPVPGPAAKPKSDLATRTLSAIVMVAVAGTALWLGGWLFTAFVVAVGLGVLWEWWGLVRRIAKTPLSAAVWMVAGVSYVGVAIWTMSWLMLILNYGLAYLLIIIGAVIGTDVGAYFAGRTIGGPKIAPSISPSKTWAGLIGGMVGASLVVLGGLVYIDDKARRAYDVGMFEPAGIGSRTLLIAIVTGILTAIIAQSGDFFESWMKRRAGVKDSGSLIPGHGGLFDRVDGLLAVLFVGGVVWLVSGAWA